MPPREWRDCVSLPLCTACPHERPALWRSSDASEAGLCGDCIDLLVDIHAEAEAFDWERWLSATATEHCSFCGRRGDDAGGLLACESEPASAIDS